MAHKTLSNPSKLNTLEGKPSPVNSMVHSQPHSVLQLACEIIRNAFTSVCLQQLSFLVAEGQGLSKLPPANLTRSFSARCSAQNPEKEKRFITFNLNSIEQTTEKLYSNGFAFCFSIRFEFFFFPLLLHLKIFRESCGTKVNWPHKQDLPKAGISLLLDLCLLCGDGMVREPSFSQLSPASGQDPQHPLSCSVFNCSYSTTAQQGRTFPLTASLRFSAHLPPLWCFSSHTHPAGKVCFLWSLKLISSLNNLALH